MREPVALLLLDTALALRPKRASVQLPQKVGEIAVARLRRRRFEGAAERCRDTGVGGRDIDANNPAIHVEIRRRRGLTFSLH